MSPARRWKTGGDDHRGHHDTTGHRSSELGQHPKHTFAPFAPFGPRNSTASNVTLPAQRPNLDLWPGQLASATSRHDFYVSVGAGSQTAVLVHNVDCGSEIENHVMPRHGPGTEGNGGGTFSEGTTPNDIQSMIDDTVENGSARPNTGGRAGTIFEQDLGSPIGTNINGQESSSLRVVLNEDGTLKTAFPY